MRTGKEEEKIAYSKGKPTKLKDVLEESSSLGTEMSDEICDWSGDSNSDKIDKIASWELKRETIRVSPKPLSFTK